MSKRIRNKYLDWMRAHLIQTVIITLTSVWFVVSTLVYILERNLPNANITSYEKSLWWGIVTFLTIGYGDFYPISTSGRVLASVLMVCGVLSVAIVTSKISSFLLEQVLREGKGMVDRSQLKDHFIICGWKEEMHELLLHILEFNSDLSASDLVLIANLTPNALDSLQQHEKLKDVHFIVGNYFETINLERSVPEKARKILILADRTPNPNGVVPSLTEVDSRTIITAMSLANIARGTLVAAEILDPKMDQYLKLASVSEIIYSREYSRLLIGNASGGTGIANIIFDLLDPKHPTSITTASISESQVGLQYSQFKQEYENKNKDCIVIGILENTGNRHRIKEQALRQAQKTPDVGRLVENLKQVKELRCNLPVFNPPENYLIPSGSMAILVKTRNLKGGVGVGFEDEHFAKAV